MDPYLFRRTEITNRVFLFFSLSEGYDGEELIVKVQLSEHCIAVKILYCTVS